MKVLLATGGSETVMAATKTVEQLAEHMELKLGEDTHLDVVIVAEQPYVYVGEGFAGPPITLGPEQIRPIEETGERMASRIAEHYHRTESHTPVATHVGELFLGSTSKYVLRHAPCSVWISRHHTKTTRDATAEAGDAVAAN